MNTNLTTVQKSILFFIGLVSLFGVLGLAGSSDYQEHVILHMSQGMYDSIVSDLTTKNGKKPSERQIVKEWEKRTGKHE